MRGRRRKRTIASVQILIARGPVLSGPPPSTAAPEEAGFGFLTCRSPLVTVVATGAGTDDDFENLDCRGGNAAFLLGRLLAVVAGEGEAGHKAELRQWRGLAEPYPNPPRPVNACVTCSEMSTWRHHQQMSKARKYVPGSQYI
jgi:hypothetical protein